MTKMTKKLRKEYIETARDLMYDFIDKGVLDKIAGCEYEEDVLRIMATMRERSDKFDWSFAF